MGVEADQAARHPGDNLIGQTLGHCVIQDVLGIGGMATVYLARQAHLERDVAIKVLPAHYAIDQAFVERFKQEARAMAQLSHPHIIVVHDAGEEQGRLYIIMEYVADGNLGDRIPRGLPLGESARIVREVASALSYAHSKNIIHRDIKPANVLMDTTGRAVLSDFGIAKVLATSAALTRVGAGVGTPEYMSPEQCRGAAIDTRADVYALGVMLYEMLTGRTPFQADSFTALAHAHVYDPVPLPAQFNPRLSPAVESVVLKALEKDPSERFQQAVELSAALDLAVAAQTPVPLPAVGRRLSGPLTGPRSIPPRAPASGSSSAPTLVCPRCRQHTAAAQRFCTQCGFGLASAPSSQYGPPSGPAQGTGRWVGCPRCRALNRGQDRYCTQCGTALAGARLVTRPDGGSRAAPLICQMCGQPNSVSQRYCTHCGQTLG